MFSPALPPRFWSKVNLFGPNGCWLWLGTPTAHGYARFYDSRTAAPGHRLAYEEMVAPIPDGMVLDHLCRTRHCVNPAHLEPVTPGENTLRGESPAAKAARRATCKWGHPYDEANTYIYKGRRCCRECNRLAARRAKERVSA